MTRQSHHEAFEAAEQGPHGLPCGPQDVLNKGQMS